MKSMIETTNFKNPRDPREPRLNEVLSYVNPLYLTWEKYMTLSKCVEQPTENQPASGSKKFQRATFQYVELNTVSDEFSPKKQSCGPNGVYLEKKEKHPLSSSASSASSWCSEVPTSVKKYIVPSTCINITKRRYCSAACAFISQTFPSFKFPSDHLEVATRRRGTGSGRWRRAYKEHGST